MSAAPPVRRLAFREACYELRRTGRLYEDGKITIDEWCSSVHRILRAAGHATSALSGSARATPARPETGASRQDTL